MLSTFSNFILLIQGTQVAPYFLLLLQSKIGIKMLTTTKIFDKFFFCFRNLFIDYFSLFFLMYTFHFKFETQSLKHT